MMGLVISLAEGGLGQSTFFTGSSDVQKLVDNPENNIHIELLISRIRQLLL